MSRLRRALPAPDILTAGGLIAALATLFWKLRILDLGTDPGIGIGPVDLYVEIIPTVEYGFSMLRTGHFPLWNPYQFCGEPFFAIGWTGLLYPPHWIRLITSIPLSVEMLLVFHLFWAGLGMWLLARHCGLGMLGGLCAAMTFMWSGWITLNNTLPGVVEVMSWMPWIVLWLERLALGRRFAWLWLILALTCQLLIGVLEVFVHSMYLGALFFLCRLVQMAWRGEAIAALRRAVLATVCVAAAVLLATPLLLPTIELSQQSTRAAGQLSLAQVTGLGGTVPWFLFLRSALETKGVVTVGAWPLIALPLALAMGRSRVIAVASMLAAVLAALLVFGGPVFELYYRIPFIGGLFRRPMKFLDIYSFGQALLAGLAVTHLSELGAQNAGGLWRRPTWLAALALGVAGLLLLTSLGTWNWPLAGVLGLLLLFGIFTPPPLRTAVLVALCVLQGASLFFTVGDTHVRPVKRPQIFHSRDMMFAALEQRLGDARIYLSPRFLFDPGLTSKQGQLRRTAVSIDYEPLATERYGTFFGRVTTRTDAAPFAGVYYLEPKSRWHLMDLTGSKFFVMLGGEPGEVYMKDHPADFRLVPAQPPVRVYERLEVLPRTYLVARGRTLPSADAVLAALDDPAFDPRAEILLEEPVPGEAVPPATPTAIGAATITSYEPERVVITARADAPGFLVLGDLHYPGWQAWVDGREVPILRANYLFRAVHLDAGTHEVRFEYHPASFRIGLWLSALTALAVGVAATWSMRR